MENLKFLTDRKQEKIIKIFKDQKEKYGIDILSSTKIQGLSGINYYQCEEALEEMKNLERIELVEIKGKRRYWKLKDGQT